METLPNAVVALGLELGVSLYIGIGVVGSVVETSPPMGPYLTVWTLLLFGAGLLACIRGVCLRAARRDGTAAVLAGAAASRKVSEPLPGGAAP